MKVWTGGDKLSDGDVEKGDEPMMDEAEVTPRGGEGEWWREETFSKLLYSTTFKSSSLQVSRGFSIFQTFIVKTQRHLSSEVLSGSDLLAKWWLCKTCSRRGWHKNKNLYLEDVKTICSHFFGKETINLGPNHGFKGFLCLNLTYWLTFLQNMDMLKHNIS